MKPEHGRNRWIDRRDGRVVTTNGEYPDLPGKWEPYFSPYRAQGTRPFYYDGSSAWVHAANTAIRMATTHAHISYSKKRGRER